MLEGSKSHKKTLIEPSSKGTDGVFRIPALLCLSILQKKLGYELFKAL